MLICALQRRAESWEMSDRPVKIAFCLDAKSVELPAVPRCGSYEVRYADGQPSQYFYWDDEASRRLRPELLTGARPCKPPRR